MANNNTINGPSYYILPDGAQLEDALFAENPTMVGPVWDAAIYLHRAGHKDGEPVEKDIGKFRHFVEFYARKLGCDSSYVETLVRKYLAAVYEKHGNPWTEER